MRAALASLLCLTLLAACGASGDTWHAAGSMRTAGALDGSGRPHGGWTYRYADGQVRERGTWDHGLKLGTWTQWYPTGQRHSEGARAWNPELRASSREGPWTFWYSNGELRAQGSFSGGLAEGPWRWWNHRGELDVRRSGTYADGERVGSLSE